MAGETIYRQWDILQELQFSKYGMTVEELAEKFGVCSRTIKRDIETLKLVGFELVCDTLEHGRKAWKLAKNLELTKTLNLSMTEMLSLFLSRQLLLPLTGTPFGEGLDSILDKIREVVPKTVLEYFESLDQSYLIKMVGSCDYSNQKGNIEVLNHAIASKTAVRLCYYSAAGGEDIDSKFHPYGMISLRHELYCVGYLEARGAKRHLKVSRIKSAKNTGELFEKPEDFSLEQAAGNSFGIFSGDDPVEIKVSFTGWAGTYVSEADWHGCTEAKQVGDDEFVAMFELGDTREFKRWLLGFGRHAKVLSPQHLADEIREEAKAMVG